MLLWMVSCFVASRAGAVPVPVGTQPAGALSGKVVYIHAGHGYTASNLGSGAWTTQRGETFELVEDLGNQDGMTMLADELWRAGATVVPLRPVGHQPNEVVVDNTDPGVEFIGAWSDSVSPIYFGEPGEVPYRFAATSPVETAVARFRPIIPRRGLYPVYAWTRPGVDRVEQLYRVVHTGGATEVRVDHRLVGNGLVYLGTFHFNPGIAGYVEISNQSDESGVVIADMIRFGNGVGDIDRGGGVSGQLREDEAGLYWVQWHVDRSQGIDSSAYRTSADDNNATVSLAPRYAAFMNRSAAGSLSDRVLVSYHSNAGGGAARGVIALVNGNNNPASATPNQFLLADTLAREINNDLVAQAGAFEHDWANRTVLTLDRTDFEFGEISNLQINDEFDATIVETGFHDNRLDAEMLRDAKVRDAIARATVQGVTRYFRLVDGAATPEAFLPAPPIHARAVGKSDGTITIAWDAPPAQPGVADPPTSYRVYTSLDGFGFDGGTDVTGSNAITLSGLNPALGVYSFRVVSVNAAGESAPSKVVAATAGEAAERVLIVDGFDRLDRFQNPRQAYFGGLTDRVRPRFSNARDYATALADAVAASDPALGVDTADNDAVIRGDVLLAAYDAVLWFLGEESTANETFGFIEQLLVTGYVQGGGGLIASGAEIGWDLDLLAGGPSFYNNTLGASYVADDAGTYAVRGTPGTPLGALSFTFDDGSAIFNVDFPDVISPEPGSEAILEYVGGIGGAAAVARPRSPTSGPVVTLGFPLIAVTDEQDRGQLVASLIDLVRTPPCPADLDGDGALDIDDVLTFLDAFANGDPIADLAPPSPVLDIDDVLAFLDAFAAGCPE